jgi:UDP-N-acetylglucosamine--N-acetylmuramyl-(pentapeptide) pyrophosphoryl-undecaprenol N-acetylglucosamine transferase
MLLVAAGGGHLAQLDRLSRRIPGAMNDDAVWVTFDTAQSRSLVSGRRHIFVPYIGPRDLRRVLVTMGTARRIVREVRPSLVVSTGNAIAVSFLPVARGMGVRSVYIESAARANGPSVTGRIVRWIPGVRLFAQYRDWAKPPWGYVGSVFDEFGPGEPLNTKAIERVVVTLGTIRFDFKRLVERLVALLPADCDVVWQVGETDVAHLPITPVKTMSSRDLQESMRRADLVVAHAGIGSALAALEVGKCPVLVPRELRYGEHVDDHQRQIAAALERRGLAIDRPVDDLQLVDLINASQRTSVRRSSVPMIDLGFSGVQAG